MTTPINLQYTTIKQPLPNFIYESLQAYSANANGYQPQPAELVERLAAKHSLPADHIFLTAGIDEAIQLFGRVHGQNTSIFTPTYIVYTDVQIFGGTLHSVDAIQDHQYKISTDQIPNASLIYLANPNNPSGFTNKQSVMQLIKNNPQATVCIDQAYGEFAPELSVIDQVGEYPNLAVFKSFSKDYAMAGNRIGYIIANPQLIATIKDHTQWCNVSYLSVGAAMASLDHESYFQDIRQGIHNRRQSLEKFLDQQGFKYLHSKINATLLTFDSIMSGTDFANFLTDQNFIISHGNGNSNTGLDQSYVRISIGTDEQMDLLKSAIKQYN